MISTAIQQLVNYGLDTGLILPDDEIYIRNQLLMTMQLDSFTEPEGDVCYTDLESILKTLVDDAVARGVCEDNSTARDLFDTKLMGVLTPRPSIVRANFEERYESEGPQAATDWFYEFSQDTDYIRRYRIKRDVKWVTKTPYGDLDITINLSKPEKDPKAIAAAKLAPQSAYPKCQLCVENEGYAGRMNHPARENHRIIPLTINGSAWNLQYSPYVYYNEHCIVFNSQHTPMKIERATFRKLLDFVGLFPHYFVGSNADLPIVGGSILSHDHFQGGHYEFAMAKAPIEKSWVFPGFEDVEGGISITDLGLNEFRMDLVEYHKKNPDIKHVPTGINAIVQGTDPGILFVLRNVNNAVNIGGKNQIHPYYLVYVRDDGQVEYGHLEPKACLNLMRSLCKGRSEYDPKLCAAYNKATRNGKDMRHASAMLEAAVGSIVQQDERSAVDSLFGNGLSTFLDPGVQGLDDFELVCFLVVQGKEA